MRSPLSTKHKNSNYVFSPERAQKNWAKLRKYVHAIMVEGRLTYLLIRKNLSISRIKEFLEINQKKIQEGTNWNEIIVFQSCKRFRVN